MAFASEEATYAPLASSVNHGHLMQVFRLGPGASAVVIAQI